MSALQNKRNKIGGLQVNNSGKMEDVTINGDNPITHKTINLEALTTQILTKEFVKVRRKLNKTEKQLEDLRGVVDLLENHKKLLIEENEELKDRVQESIVEIRDLIDVIDEKDSYIHELHVQIGIKQTVHKIIPVVFAFCVAAYSDAVMDLLFALWGIN